ncbi:MAG: phytanoyl-CoA dioxygenase family protein [Planctomycetaceae bacterium]|nr:phytanoyl-CoA dioxygenase family protein [Planctomycetaceae bacterium]
MTDASPSENLRREDLQRIVSDYERDGVVVIRQLFDAETVAEIRAETQRYVLEDLPSKPAGACTFEADDRTVRNLWRLQEHNPWFRQLAERRSLMDMVAPLVKGEVVAVAVETFSKPARIGSGVPPHQDNAYFCRTPPDMLTLWVAIDPVTAENGPVCFIKGSHKAGMLPTKPSGVRGNSIGLAEPPDFPPEDRFCALLSPGDATIHHCEVIHESAPNTSDQPRLALLFVYRGSHTQTDPHLKTTYTAAVTATPPA